MDSIAAALPKRPSDVMPHVGWCAVPIKPRHMTLQKLPPISLVLTLAAQGGAARHQQQYGGNLESRFLNVTGRWASAGKEVVPLLTWPDMETAVEAATTATAARGREVDVTSVGGSRFGELTQYGQQHSGALVGYLGSSQNSENKAR